MVDEHPRRGAVDVDLPPHGSAVIVGESSGTVWLGPVTSRWPAASSAVFADVPPPRWSSSIPASAAHLSGDDLRFEMSIGVRTWGNSMYGSTRSVICAYEGRSEVSARLLDALPTVSVLRADEWDTPLVDLLATGGFRRSGREAYLDRLLDLLLIAVVRTWFDRPGNAPTWWHAEQDPMVGRR